MALDSDSWGQDIADSIDKTGMNASEIADFEAAWKNICSGHISHMVSKMEVNGVQVADPAGTVETYTAGVGNNAGALATPTEPVNGSVNKAAETHTQSNDGTGHIA